MNKKNTIHLTEREFKSLISEAIKQILINESKTIFKKHLIIDLADVDMFENQELEEFFADNNVPYDTVDVIITYEEFPAYRGDYYNEPQPEIFYLNDCVVDPYEEFKKILPEHLYSSFIDEINYYVENNYKKYLKEEF